VRLKALMAGGLSVAALAGGAGYVQLAREDAGAKPTAHVKPAIADWRWAPRDELPGRAEPPAETAEKPKPRPKPRPKPKPKPKRRRQTETETQAEPDSDVDVVDLQASRDVKKVPSLRTPGASDDILAKAEVLKNGVALPPLDAPPEVRAIFEAGNTIARSPYKWGGGHGKWQDNGYDCSGSVSYALASAGLLDRPMASGPLMKYGKPGKGKWITIYSNPGHVWMVVAGVRFDTVARGQTGSRWINSIADTSGYVARHPPGF
jgi:cell wall-associated NlpC family hydrolase